MRRSTKRRHKAATRFRFLTWAWRLNCYYGLRESCAPPCRSSFQAYAGRQSGVTEIDERFSSAQPAAPRPAPPQTLSHQSRSLHVKLKVDWTDTNIAASGNVVLNDVVLNERIDIFTHESGGTITLPVMGTVTVENGVITMWRDYFDLIDFGK